MRSLSRRRFVQLSSIAALGTAVAPLGRFNTRVAAANGHCFPASFLVDGFGPIGPKVPLNTNDLGDVPGLGDIRGVAMLALPHKFQYTAISIRGNLMSDGELVPGDHDGMACFQGRQGNYILVRNHELSIDENEAGSIVGCRAPNGKQYDPFQGDAAGLGGGGTTNVVVDRHGRLVEDYISIGGTIRNCAGGPTPWGSWITCEETTTTPASDELATKKHGYNFEAPSQIGEAVDPIPLIAMGRMNHEAVSVDPQNGYVYETEDRGDSCWYRFIPHRNPNGFGDLQQGGDLYAMVIDPNQVADCDSSIHLPTSIVQGAEVVDTRGLGRGAPDSMLPFLGQPLKVSWVKLDDVDPDGDTLRFEAQSKGAALFWRGEGAWYHRGKHYWVCSGAGDEEEGQVYCYDPQRETVSLIVESTNENFLDGPDNMTIARDGTIYLCEDGSGGIQGKSQL